MFIVLVTIAIVFLILVLLLRAIVAPLYLIGSVLISFLSALGIGVIVYQFILGKELHWSLPGLTFILLVAVGADYNMLLISRIRDESPHGVRIGVIRTVGSTGGVITSAGLIFAASMFGLVPASISTMSEAGFIIGVGIVLDTFLVRTITVPAVAALIGQANWWPSRLGSTGGRRKLARKRPPTGLSARILQLKDRYGRKAETAVSTPLTPPATSPAAGHNGHGSDELLGDHALPLFSLGARVNGGLRDLTDAQRETTLPRTPNRNGERPADDLPVHALPLFGANGLLHRLTGQEKTLSLPAATNGNANGNVRATQLIDHLSTHALPLFGLNCLPATINGTNGNGHTNGKRPVDEPKNLTDTSGVS